MPNYNNCEIIGHVGKEPEMRFTPNGAAVTNFSVAVNSKNGEKDSTEWFNVITWRKLAETANQFISKGMLIFASGRIELHRWENSKTGQPQANLQLTANKIVFLSKNENTEYTNENTDDGFVPDDVQF